MTVYELVNELYDHLRGTPNDLFLELDSWIEEGKITQEFYQKNEVEILDKIDSMMFNCECCG